MMFDENGRRIRPTDIQKSQLIFDGTYVNASTGPCKGLCNKYKGGRTFFKSRENAGQVYCKGCQVFIELVGVVLRNEISFCKCCNFQVNVKPHDIYKIEQSQNQWVRNVNESWVAPQDDVDIQINNQEKKSTPIYVQRSGKSYYELKDFITSEIRPKANYQFVMLKHLSTHTSAHRGEIAESLAYFNNKDTSKIEEVKPFLDVPVYYVLVNHGFVKEHYSILGIKWYELNVDFDHDYQKFEIDELLEKKIEEWNENHGILHNQFECRGINWEEQSNLLRESNNWIWPVTKENWQILKNKNIWGSKIPHYKIQQKVFQDDYIIFYVIGTKAFKGIYKASGNWYDDSKNLTWDDEKKQGQPIYLSAVKIKPVIIGTAKIDDLLDLTIFEGKDQNLVNLVLKGGSGYPSNNQKSIPSNDFHIIKKMLEQHPEEIKQEEPIELEIDGQLNQQAQQLTKKLPEEKTDSDWVIKECPKCQYKIEGLSGPGLDNKIEEIFGYRPMDPNDPSDRKSQSYCRKCRKREIDGQLNQQAQQLTKKLPEEKTDSDWVIKECPKCQYKIEGLSGPGLDNKIEEIFGYRQMDPNDPSDRKSQSYCRKCRKREKPSIEKPESKQITTFVSQDNGVYIKHFELQYAEHIQQGQTLTNDELVAKFGVGNIDGIHYSSKNNIIVLCATESGQYIDEIDKEFQIIFFTGEGYIGDQTLTGGNQSIVESKDTPMFYFIEVPQEPGQNKRGALGKIYKFVGKVKYLKHAIKTENDINGNPRNVIKFLLEVEQ